MGAIDIKLEEKEKKYFLPIHLTSAPPVPTNGNFDN
jgi:hypothetical protein